MSAGSSGILDQPIAETPVAIIDFETTGLNAGRDRAVEVSVVRRDPGKEPRLVFDTLINPERRVGGTEIHGITDEDVADAPKFNDIASDVLRAASGCVVASYNVYFDIKFLEEEFRRSGLGHTAPHFCLMYMRPMLGLGSRCSLEDACRAHGVDYASAHVASSDALAGANLLEIYLGALQERGVETFGDLARLKSYKFIDSFSRRPFRSTRQPDDGPVEHWKSRVIPKEPPRPNPLVEYWNALLAVITDLEITDEEIAYLDEKRRALTLDDDQVRMLHARVFSAAISQFIEDERIDERESRKLKRLSACLGRLGWAPGQ